MIAGETGGPRCIYDVCSKFYCVCFTLPCLLKFFTVKVLLMLSVFAFQSKSSKRLSKGTHDMLAEIFKKIGQKENTREVSGLSINT